MTSPPLLRQLGAIASGINTEAMPGQIRARYMDAILDYLGAVLAGRSTATSDAFTMSAEGLGGAGTSSILGSAVRTSPLIAAAANAASGHALELDDLHRDVTGWHPGTTVIPAVLAVGDRDALSGDSILAGIVAGYEIGARIGAVMAAEHRSRGFHATGTVGALAAAAGAARALGFASDDIGSAIGLATSMASGTFGVLAGAVSAKHLHAAHAALAGVWATALVEAGFHGPLGALETPGGFYSAFAGGVSDLESVTRPLGEPWAIERQWVKQHASCGHSFSAIDAAQAIRTQVSLPLDEISRIEVHTYKAAAVLNEQQPATMLDAQFSIPFCVALAIDERRSIQPLSIRDFAPDRLSDPELRRLAQTVVVELDPASEAAFPAKRLTTVTVVDTAGNASTHSVEQPRGMPENPLSPSEVREKYRGLAQAAIGDDRAKHVEQLVDDILGHDAWSLQLAHAVGSTEVESAAIS